MLIKRLEGISWVPTRAHDDDAGLDLRSPVDTIIYPHSCEKIDLNLAFQLPSGTYGRIASRSSMYRLGLMADGVIDAGYRGNVSVLLRNLTDDPMHINCGDKIAQLILEAIKYDDVIVVDKLTETDRGAGGFGSTGR